MSIMKDEYLLQQETNKKDHSFFIESINSILEILFKNLESLPIL